MRVIRCGLIFFLAILTLIINIWLLYRSNYSTTNVHIKRKFYIYDWPSSIVDLWPENYTHHRISIHPHFRNNFGAGEIIDEVHGMYHTHQYSLFTLLLERLKRSEHYTSDPSEADLFFIPYDLGMDSSTRRSDGALTQTNCPQVEVVMKRLRKSDYFQHSQGSNHFILHSINQMMVYYANDYCTRLYELCYNCTKLSIDSYPPGIYTHLDRRPHLSHKWLSIPFPSNYHHSHTSIHPLWNEIVRDPTYITHRYNQERPFALCFTGSTKVTAKKQQALRLRLVAACREHPADCLYRPLSSHESHESIFHTAAATAGARNHTATTSTRNPYAVSKLCLMPGGDFPTRKGLLDALHSGCVPVIFETTAALSQWPLHWSVSIASTKPPIQQYRQHIDSDSIYSGMLNADTDESERVNLAASCVVYLPRSIFMRNTTAGLQYLLRLSSDRDFMAGKLRCIAEVAFQLQYSLPSTAAANVEHTSEHFYMHANRPPSGKGVALSNKKDAVDVLLEHLLAT